MHTPFAHGKKGGTIAPPKTVNLCQHQPDDFRFQRLMSNNPPKPNKHAVVGSGAGVIRSAKSVKMRISSTCITVFVPDALALFASNRRLLMLSKLVNVAIPFGSCPVISGEMAMFVGLNHTLTVSGAAVPSKTSFIKTNVTLFNGLVDRTAVAACDALPSTPSQRVQVSMGVPGT